ncbi:flagellar hook-basal body complex protein [Legionella quateirensis]|uniref:Flagellar hook protein FlgE n=1 Tax=Legionella quateirensis TaxID=45072 RepID=A0A378KWZ7_9GAMM|nr:flagellar hook-basal body complex protein [Legionella quateirensis]KTD52678.1 flagellar hook protein FlgE [Legionella quateirensis]STY19095.1 flagellar hook protein FlgE [Legionella quateirensis]
MHIKSMLVAAALVISHQLYAGTLFKLTKEPLTINQCPISVTDNPFDLALTNKGYFVVSRGKKDSELLFTRLGRMFLDKDYYIRSDEGDYLLAVTKKSDAKHLSKIKIPIKNLAPKATSKIHISINLPASATDGSEYENFIDIYDSLSNRHLVTIKSSKMVMGTWQARVFVDDVERDKGILVFNSSGTLSKQEGLGHILWPAEYGMHELKIDFNTSTQFASPFSTQFTQIDGYPMGVLIGANVTRDGEISLMYTNGHYKLLRNRIAVAIFTNPGYLEHVTSRLYRPSEKSGNAMIHWVNGEYSVLSGALEEEACLIN